VLTINSFFESGKSLFCGLSQHVKFGPQVNLSYITEEEISKGRQNKGHSCCMGCLPNKFYNNFFKQGGC
jgi:hypothetical protein